jgi:UrcA family protein
MMFRRIPWETIMTLQRNTAFIGAAACLLLAAATAGAGESGIRVTYADLDLNTATGVDTLYRRINTAAQRWCEDLNLRTGSRLSTGYRECVTDAVNSTVSALNLPGLSALHADRSRPKHRS